MENSIGFKQVNEWSAYSIKFPLLYGPQDKNTCLQGLANNKGADQPAHARSLISVFVILLLESIKSRLATS